MKQILLFVAGVLLLCGSVALFSKNEKPKVVVCEEEEEEYLPRQFFMNEDGTPMTEEEIMEKMESTLNELEEYKEEYLEENQE